MEYEKILPTTEYGPTTLGCLIDEFEILCAKPSHRSDDRSPNIYYDFGNFRPTYAMSYRGYYQHLAFSIQEPGEKWPTWENDDRKAFHRTIEEFLRELKSNVGMVHEGYKGGDFTMNRDTPVWCTSYQSDASGTAIVGVEFDGYDYYLKTKNCNHF